MDERVFSFDELVHERHEIPRRGDCNTWWERALCVTFREHLAHIRGTSGPRPTEIDCQPATAAGPGDIMFPHLIALRVEASVRDVVLWERMPEADFRSWLPDVGPDEVEHWRGRLSDLLWLRGTLREGVPLSTPDGRRLRDALTDRYLSFKFVLEHTDLVRSVLDAPRAGRRAGADR